MAPGPDSTKAATSKSRGGTSGGKATTNTIAQLKSLASGGEGGGDGHYSLQQLASAQTLRVKAPQFYPQGEFYNKLYL